MQSHPFSQVQVLLLALELVTDEVDGGGGGAVPVEVVVFVGGAVAVAVDGGGGAVADVDALVVVGNLQEWLWAAPPPSPHVPLTIFHVHQPYSRLGSKLSLEVFHVHPLCLRLEPKRPPPWDCTVEQ